LKKYTIIEIDKIKEVFNLFVQTHTIMAHHISEHIRQDFNLSLDKYSFTWGNIKPDLFKSYIKDKHYMAESIDSVSNKILELSYLNPSNIFIERNFDKFSLHMGIICHYICDFFCLPHFKRWKYFEGETIEHFLYEKRLNTKAKEISTPKKILLPDSPDITPVGIKNLINETQSEYKHIEDYKRDILYAINICSEVIKRILNAIFNKRPKYVYSCNYSIVRVAN